MPSSPVRSDDDFDMGDDATPRPKRADNHVDSESDSKSDSEPEPFRTPSVLIKKNKYCYIEVTDEDTEDEMKVDKQDFGKKQKVNRLPRCDATDW